MNTIWTVLIVIGALLFLGGCAVIFLVVNLKPTDSERRIAGWKVDESVNVKAGMKKYNISRIATAFFLGCIVISIRYFDGEGATLFIFATIAAMISSIINFKLNR